MQVSPAYKKADTKCDKLADGTDQQTDRQWVPYELACLHSWHTEVEEDSFRFFKTLINKKYMCILLMLVRGLQTSWLIEIRIFYTLHLNIEICYNNIIYRVTACK